MRLRRRQCEYVRDVAKLAYLETGDRDAAIALAEERLRNAPGSILTAILIKVAIALAVELIKYWVLNGVSRPTDAYQDDEPGFDGFGDEAPESSE